MIKFDFHISFLKDLNIIIRKITLMIDNINVMSYHKMI